MINKATESQVFYCFRWKEIKPPKFLLLKLGINYRDCFLFFYIIKFDLYSSLLLKRSFSSEDGTAAWAGRKRRFYGRAKASVSGPFLITSMERFPQGKKLNMQRREDDWWNTKVWNHIVYTSIRHNHVFYYVVHVLRRMYYVVYSTILVFRTRWIEARKANETFSPLALSFPRTVTTMLVGFLQ